MKDSLRISVTQKCNLSCDYCHNEGQVDSKEEMTLEKIRAIAKAAKEIGIKKIKITGGEPLLREDIIEIVDAFNEFEDVSIVTNGILLERYAKKLKSAGLKRVNIGCDSLTNATHKNKDKIITGVKEAKRTGLNPIKINMVVLKGINDHEIKDMIDFAKQNGAILQLIELIDTNNTYYKKHYFNLFDIENYLESKALLVKIKDMQNRKIYSFGDSTIEVVRPFHNHFCENCKRIRITNDGKIKTCLLKNDNLTDFNGLESLQNAMGELVYDRHN